MKLRSHQGKAQLLPTLCAVYTPASSSWLTLILSPIVFPVAFPRMVLPGPSSFYCLVLLWTGYIVPVAVVASISRAARDGILIKGGAHLETLGRIRAIAFDKTGTLTRGLPAVTNVIPLDGYPPDEVLRLAASVEAASEHPLSGAILRAAQERGIQWAQGRDLKALPGIGVEATVDGQRLFVGKPNGLSSDINAAPANQVGWGGKNCRSPLRW